MDMKMKRFSWKIDNMSERKDVIELGPFSSGGCDWGVDVYPKRCYGKNHLYVFLTDVNRSSLQHGWKRRFFSCIVLLNQSGKELYRSPDGDKCNLLCAEAPCLGYQTSLTMDKLQENGLMKKNKLTVVLEIKVVEVVHQGNPTAYEIIDVEGFHVFAYQVPLLYDLIINHQGFERDFLPTNHGVETAYLNLLLRLVETLGNPPQSLSVSELSNAKRQLTQLTEVGFKLDWLKSKLKKLSLERKNALADESYCVQQFEDQSKDMDMKIKFPAATKLTPIVLISYFVNRFFLSCFSISK